MKILETHFKKLLIILCLTTSPIASAEFRHFNDWEDSEKRVFLLYSTLSYIDYSQTKYALNDPCECYVEANPIWGKNPHPDKLLLGNILINGLIYTRIGRGQPESFNSMLVAGSVLRAGVIYHNQKVGIHWSVAF